MGLLRSFFLLIPIAIPAVIFSIEQGFLRVPLPSVASGYFVERIESEDYPPTPRTFQEYNYDNTTLATATRLFEGKIHGSESVAVSQSGTLFLADKFGRVWKAHPHPAGSYQLEDAPFSFLGAGRPLGIHLDQDENLVVCDSLKGLLRVDATTGNVELLAATTDPLDPLATFSYTNDLDISADGTIYFTTSQAFSPIRNPLGFWDTLQAYLTGSAAGRHAGKLLAYNPATRRTTVLLTGLWFANGVALAADESFVLVVETQWLRVHRYWLKGPQAGKSEVVVDRLPAFPDGIERAPDGGFWVSLVAPILPVYKLTRSPTLRSLVAWLPASLRPKPQPQGIALKISAALQPEKLLLEPTGRHVAFVSGVKEVDGKLFIGNLVGSYVSVVKL